MYKKLKKSSKTKIFFLAVFVLLFLLSLSASAKEADSPEHYMDELREILPDLVKEQLPEDGEEESVRELFGAEYLVSLLLSGFDENRETFLTELLKLCGLVFISAAAMLFGRRIKNQSNSKLVESAVLVICATTLFAMMQGSLDRAFAYLSDLLDFSNRLIPIVSGIYLSGGNAATASVSTAVLVASTSAIENVCVSALTPVVYICFGFVAVSALGGGVDTSGIAKTLRNGYITVVTLCGLIITSMLTFQSTIAAASDSLAARTVKFAVGNLVPIVGGSVGDSLRTVGASLSLIKSTVGVVSVFAIISITLPPIVSLLMSRFMINLSSGVAGLLGCAREKKLLDDMRGIYDVICAVVAASSVQFIIILTVFLKTSLAIA